MRSPEAPPPRDRRGTRERLAALRRYDILDTEPEPAFDFIAELAADLLDAPIALVNFVDADRQWSKANVGGDQRETGLEVSVCVHTIATDGVLVVEDLSADLRFEDNPYVTEEGLQFYAGAPLVTPDGHRIGTLCVLDPTPRTPSNRQLRQLERLASMVVDELELRRENGRRKQTEAVLRRQRKKYETLFESAGEAILVHDAEGRITDANRQATALFRATEGGLVGMSLFDLHPPTLQDVPRQKLAALRREQWYGVVSPYRRIDGRRFWGHLQATAVEIDGELLIRSMIRDVTEQKAAEQRLRRKNEELRTLIDEVPVMIAFFDADGTPQLVNQHVEKTLGWTQQDVRETNVLDRLFPDEEILKKGRRHIRNASADWSEFEVQTKGGDTTLIQVTTRQLRDGRRIGIGIDVAEKKKREEQLQLLRAAVEHSKVSVLITEATSLDAPDPAVVYANPMFTEMTGYSRDEVEGRSPRMLQGPDTDRAALDRIRTALGDGEAVREIVRNYRKDGTLYWNDIYIAPVRDETGEVTHFVSIQDDVTERVRRREELEEAKAVAEDAARIKSVLLSNMNHELRTPLTSIISFARLIEQTPALADKFAERILGGGERLLRTLNTVMDLAELEEGQRSPAPQAFDVREVVSSVANDFRRDADRKGLALRVDRPESPVAAVLDPDYLERICTHLLSNAVKFTEEGTVILGARAKTDAIRIWVQDTGIGIDADFRPNVFDEFAQASSGDARTHDGNGIGLTITKRLVDQMDGAIEIESTPEDGTLVTVTLPNSR